MNTKKMFKRLAAVTTGVAMLGATITGALAANLNQYPEAFVEDGTFNGFFVAGEAAASVDNLAMTDIATNMWVAESGSTASVTTVEGDAWLAGTSSKKLEIANSDASTLSGEQLYDLEQFIDKEELGGLADGTYSTSGSQSTFRQYLYFDVNNDAQNQIVGYFEDDNQVTADFFYVKNGANIGRYELEFASKPESDILTTAGAVSTSGTVLDDFEDTSINMFGQEYTIVLARRPQSVPQNSIKLTLMGGAASGSLNEGETGTFTVSGESYDVELTFVDGTYAKFVVNGETTNRMQVGDTFQLASGVEIGVSEILYQSYAGGIHSADFFIGADKIELRDNDITDTTGGTELKMGTETIDGADVIITGTDDNSTFRLSTIEVNMTAQDAYYVPAGGKLSEAIADQGDEPELLFGNTWDIEYAGLSSEATHDIMLYSSTDRKYKLRYYDGDNNMVDMPLLYATDSSNVQFSEEATSDEIILNEGLNISKDDYFVISGGSASSGTAKTYTLQYRNGDKTSASDPQISFKNLGSGETLEYSVDTGTTDTVATINLGGYSFAVENRSVKTTADFDIAVDLDADGTIEGNAEVDIIDYYGLQLDFGGFAATNSSGSFSSSGGFVQPAVTNATSVDLVFTTPNSNDYDDQTPATINVTADAASTNEVTISSLAIGGTSNPLLTPDGEENVAYGYTTMGGFIEYTTPSSSPNEFTYSYPENQRTPMVYVTSGSTSRASTVDTSNLMSVRVVDAVRLDSEISDVEAQNLIVVGGPCVNSVAAELLGNPADCTEGFTPGVARVKMFEHSNGNVAMLVAGYSGADTRLAGAVLAHRWNELSGEEVEIEGTTYQDAVVRAPSPVVAAEEEAMDEMAEESASEE